MFDDEVRWRGFHSADGGRGSMGEVLKAELKHR